MDHCSGAKYGKAKKTYHEVPYHETHQKSEANSMM